MNHVKKFYSKYKDYLEDWTVQYIIVDHFRWVTLKLELNWNDVQKSFDYISQKFPNSNISGNDLFNEVSLVKKYIDKENLKYWASEKNHSTRKQMVRNISSFGNNVSYNNGFDFTLVETI